MLPAMHNKLDHNTLSLANMSSSADMMSPIRSQPMKKQRSGATPLSRQRQPGPGASKISIDADDAIARRRAELRRLQQQKAKHTPGSVRPKPTTTEVVKDTSKPTRATSVERKVGGKAPPPPPVARKLEFNSNNKQRAPRAKSVPPRRPPPPPKRSQQAHKEAPPTVRDSSARKDVPSARPAPTDPSLLMKHTAATAPPLFAAVTTTDSTVKQQQQAASMVTRPLVAEPLKTDAKTPGPSAKLGVTSGTPAATVEDSTAEVKTPASISSTIAEPPSTMRRDRIQQLRQGLDSPKSNPMEKSPASPKGIKEPSINSSQTNTTLEKALKQAEHEKNKALKQIKELEAKLMKEMTSTAPVTPVKDMTSLREVMDMAKTQGEDAALQWAQEQLQGQEKLQHKKVGLLSPAIPTTPQARRTVVNRAATPHPKRDVKGGVTDEDIEKNFIASFREAVTYIPYEYYGAHESEDGKRCTFYVRRPYGIPDQNGVFELVSPSSHDKYSRKAHVSDHTTIQVAVVIPYDESVFCLVGKMGVRYRVTPTGTFENIPNVQDSLGFVSYIDDTANEQQYSLDEILEEALSVREQYCSTMMTTALGFQQRKPVMAQPATEAAALSPEPEVAEIGVDTSDIPIPQEIAVNSGKGKIAKKQEAEKEEPKKKEPKKEAKDMEDDGSTGAGDVLTIFIGMVVKSLFGFVWWVLIGLPLATIRASVTIVFASAVVGMLYLYTLNGHYGGMLQENEAFFYASQYHSNTAPGVL